MKKVFVMFVTVLALAGSVCGGVGGVAVKGAAEIAEALAKNAGKKAASRELTKFGGEKALQASLEKAVKEGGEELAGKVIQYGKKHGLSAVKAIDHSPALYVKALDGIPPNLVKGALAAVEREPQIITQLVKTHGPDALRVAVEYRGVGVQIVSKLGDDGIRVAKHLSGEQQAITIAKHADSIAKLPAADKAKVMDKLCRSTKSSVDFLEKHPKTLLTAAGLAAFLASKDKLIGDEAKPGWIERQGDKIMEPLKEPIKNLAGIAAIVLGGIIMVWGVIKIWGIYRLGRMKIALAEQKVSSELLPMPPANNKTGKETETSEKESGTSEKESRASEKESGTSEKESGIIK